MTAAETSHVTTEGVMKAITSYAESPDRQHFTTLDIARFMEVDEYPVRSAVSWLNRYQMIEVVPGVRSKRYTKAHGEEYSATVYQVRKTSEAADFVTLTRVFCGG